MRPWQKFVIPLSVVWILQALLPISAWASHKDENREVHGKKSLQQRIWHHHKRHHEKIANLVSRHHDRLKNRLNHHLEVIPLVGGILGILKDADQDTEFKVESFDDDISEPEYSVEITHQR